MYYCNTLQDFYHNDDNSSGLETRFLIISAIKIKFVDQATMHHEIVRREENGGWSVISKYFGVRYFVN